MRLCLCTQAEHLQTTIADDGDWLLVAGEQTNTPQRTSFNPLVGFSKLMQVVRDAQRDLFLFGFALDPILDISTTKKDSRF